MNNLEAIDVIEGALLEPEPEHVPTKEDEEALAMAAEALGVVRHAVTDGEVE